MGLARPNPKHLRTQGSGALENRSSVGFGFEFGSHYEYVRTERAIEQDIGEFGNATMD